MFNRCVHQKQEKANFQYKKAQYKKAFQITWSGNKEH